jgi:ATP-binding cassette subfamily B protein
VEKRTQQTLWSVTQGQRPRYAGAVLAMALASLFMFAAPLFGKYAIDVAIGRDVNLGLGLLVLEPQDWLTSDPFVQYLALSALVTIMATAMGGYFHYLRGRWAAIASEGIIRRVREQIYQQLHHIKASFFDSADTGDLVQRCSSDVETLRMFLSTDTVEIGRAVILLLTVTPILFYLHPPLAWVSLALMPFLILFAYIFFFRVKKVFLQTDEAEARMTTVLQENLAGIRVVRAFARQRYEIDKFGERNREFRDYNNRLIRLMGLYWGISDFFALLQVGMVLFAGAYWVIQGDISIGTLFAFLTYESMVIYPVRHLGRVLTNTGKATVSLERINLIMGEIRESVDPIPEHSRATGALTVNNVQFAYRPEMPVLQGLNIAIAAGESVALVGPPGSGKSTLIRLMLRLYVAQSGSIKLDGVDIEKINRKWLRTQIGVVLQDPFLYSRTIEENLLVGSANAVSTAVQRACVDAAIHDSVSGFPLGYQTPVGERGVMLSGGQRQRLALARALLKDPAILVLDDSLSAVDTGTEKHILQALARRRGRHTTITIAHRLSSVVQADRIIVLDHGRVAQTGTHVELSSIAGPYQDLCRVQKVLESRLEEDLATTPEINP